MLVTYFKNYEMLVLTIPIVGQTMEGLQAQTHAQGLVFCFLLGLNQKRIRISGCAKRDKRSLSVIVDLLRDHLPDSSVSPSPLNFTFYFNQLTIIKS